MEDKRDNFIESQEIFDRLRKIILKLHSFDQLLKKMIPWISQENEILLQNVKTYREEILYGEKKAEDILIDIICKDNICYLNNAKMEFIDRKSLWQMINEILLNEDYYVEYDTDQPTIFDCGANIGLAVYYFKTLYPKAKIICFEPWDKAYAILIKNIKDNGWTDVTVYPYALSNINCHERLFIPEENSLGASLTERCYEYVKDDSKIEKKIVEIRRLSEFIHESIDFLKLDIEGAEKKVLYEIESMLPKVRFIFCEYHYGNLVKDNSLADIVSLLEKNNFIYEIGKSHTYQKRTKKRPMLNVGKVASMVIWAQNSNYK
ncbi:MAG TPA: FkbM family methyltransferase [Bacillales bacterium]|nr:FkbM family methyltransferase [Bacillales bacterium]